MTISKDANDKFKQRMTGAQAFAEIVSAKDPVAVTKACKKIMDIEDAAERYAAVEIIEAYFVSVLSEKSGEDYRQDAYDVDGFINEHVPALQDKFEQALEQPILNLLPVAGYVTKLKASASDTHPAVLACVVGTVGVLEEYGQVPDKILLMLGDVRDQMEKMAQKPKLSLVEGEAQDDAPKSKPAGKLRLIK
ncbi:MAG: hypothetical protein OXT65_01665 [Alphaproteobacteria bacterium]|nr:hypothetical protein [Alphaproteobacteria bacterium]